MISRHTTNRRLPRVAEMAVALLLGGASAAAPQSASGVPSASNIIARYVKAIGGKKAILSHSSRYMKGKFEIPAQGFSAELEIFAAKPNKRLSRVTIKGMGEMVNGFDGKVGWSMNPRSGATILEGKALRQRMHDADFYAPLHEASNFKSMENLGVSDFDGKRCYKLKLVTSSGLEYFEFYDIQTGLLVGMSADVESPMGPVPTTIFYDQYKRFDGVLTPTRIRQKLMGRDQVVTISSIEYDGVKDSVFALPDKVKALLKK